MPAGNSWLGFLIFMIVVFFMLIVVLVLLYRNPVLYRFVAFQVGDSSLYLQGNVDGTVTIAKTTNSSNNTTWSVSTTDFGEQNGLLTFTTRLGGTASGLVLSHSADPTVDPSIYVEPYSNTDSDAKYLWLIQNNLGIYSTILEKNSGYGITVDSNTNLVSMTNSPTSFKILTSI